MLAKVVVRVLRVQLTHHFWVLALTALEASVTLCWRKLYLGYCASSSHISRSRVTWDQERQDESSSTELKAPEDKELAKAVHIYICVVYICGAYGAYVYTYIIFKTGKFPHIWSSIRLTRTIWIYYIYGVYLVFLAGRSQSIRSYTEYIYSSGHPYKHAAEATEQTLQQKGWKTGGGPFRKGRLHRERSPILNAFLWNGLQPRSWREVGGGRKKGNKQLLVKLLETRSHCWVLHVAMLC